MAYSSLKLFGNQKVDYLIQTNEVLSEEEIQETLEPLFKPDVNTFPNKVNIMAPYTDDIVSSFIKGLTEPLVGWQIYKSKQGETFLTKVAEVDKDITSIVDYMVANQTEYTYYVIPITENQLGINLRSSPVKTNWWNWSVMSINNVEGNIYIPDEIWIFRNNLTSGQIQQNIDKTTYQNFTKYPKVSSGESNYVSGSISCLLGDVDCKNNKYIEPAEKFDAWRNFCVNGKNVILKDAKGHIYRVEIISNSSQYADEIRELPSTISFSFVECDSTEDITVYES